MIISLNQTIANSAIKDGDGNVISTYYQRKLTAGTGITLGTDGAISVSGTLTDTKTTQNKSTANGAYRILVKKTANDTNETDTVCFASGVTINPSTSTVSATAFVGTTFGGYSLGSACAKDDTYFALAGHDHDSAYASKSVATTSADGLMSSADKTKLDGVQTGATAVSFTQNLTSGTKVGTITINGTGTDLYCQTDTDTDKKTSSTATTGKKLFLVGATSQSSSGVATSSNANCYVGTDNCLYSGGVKVLTAHQSLTDYATKSDVSSAIASVYKVKGNITALEAASAIASGTNVNNYYEGKTSSAAGTLTALANGDVFNLTEAATLAINGTASTAVAKGSNIVWIKDTGWDRLSSDFDLSGYIASSSVSASNPTLAWNTESTVGSVGGVDFKVKLPANPNTDTHYTTHLYTGAASTASNSAQTNGKVYLTLADDTTVRESHKIVGSGGTTVSSDANGVITINSSTAYLSSSTKYAGASTAGGAATSAVGYEATGGIATALAGKQATVISSTVTIATADWSSNACTKSVTGVTASNTVLVGYSSDSEVVCATANVRCTAQTAGKLTFSCSSVPTAAVVLNLVIIP